MTLRDSQWGLGWGAQEGPWVGEIWFAAETGRESLQATILSLALAGARPSDRQTRTHCQSQQARGAAGTRAILALPHLCYISRHLHPAPASLLPQGLCTFCATPHSFQQRQVLHIPEHREPQGEPGVSLDDTEGSLLKAGDWSGQTTGEGLLQGVHAAPAVLC